MDEAILKGYEVQFRQWEIQETLNVLKSINNGNGDSIRKSSSRGEGDTLSGWKGVLDFNHLIMSGHSFGTNAAVCYLTWVANQY
jgi:platelet-activating factor acetylhydrolase